MIDGMRASEAAVADDCSGAPAGARLIELGFGNRTRGIVERVLQRTPTIHSNLPPVKPKPCPEPTGTTGGGGGPTTGGGGGPTGGGTTNPCPPPSTLDGSIGASPNPMNANGTTALSASANGGLAPYTIEIDNGNGMSHVGSVLGTTYPQPDADPVNGTGKASYTAIATITDACGDQVKRMVTVTVLCSGHRIVSVGGQTYIEICGRFTQHAVKVRWVPLTGGVTFTGSPEFYESDPGQAAVCTPTQCDAVAKLPTENPTNHFGALFQTSPAPTAGQQFRVIALDGNDQELEHIDVTL
jgi:hypothetical protein